MRVSQEWKSHTNIIKLTWGDNKKLKIELTSAAMILTPSNNVPTDIVQRVLSAYVKWRDQNRYSEFRGMIIDTASLTTDLSSFLERIEQ